MGICKLSLRYGIGGRVGFTLGAGEVELLFGQGGGKLLIHVFILLLGRGAENVWGYTNVEQHYM